MSQVRVLVGTRKGAFILNSDGKREHWNVSGPHFAGWEMYHLKGSPADPNRLYASPSNGWFGQLIQRSNDGGKTWEPMGNKFEYDGIPGTHQWYDGTPHPWKFARVWHLEPSLTDPDTVYAGVEDAALFRSTDGAKTWEELSGLRKHGSGPSWQPGAGGMCLHTIILIRVTRNGYRLRFRLLAPSARTTPEKPGARLTGALRPKVFRIPTPKSAIACTTSPLTLRAPTCSSCKNIGTLCAATTPAIPGRKSAETCPLISDSRSMFMPTNPKRSTSCRLRATPNIIRSMDSCAYSAANRAAPNGSR